jgi:dihydroorotate dehydrogenase (fumarate)
MLQTKYMGLELRNPLIAGSCGLTNTIEHLKEIEKAGAGAIIIKSIFEEQIIHDSAQHVSDDQNIWKSTFNNLVSQKEFYYDEALAYMENYAKEHQLDQYLDFLRKAKKEIKIPIIASIHCTSQYNWQYFAKRIQDTGVDAIELNAFLLPSNFERTSAENEKIYFEIISEIKKYVTIPVALKLGFYFSGLSNTLQKLSESGISAFVLFNRSFNPDIDIDRLEMTNNNTFSTSEEYFHTLRWVAILSGKIKTDIAASTGIHSGEAAIKQILAGADAVQVVSAMYKHGFGIFTKMQSEIEAWMKKHNFTSIDEFKGKLSQSRVENPAAYERVQFIKIFTSIY